MSVRTTRSRSLSRPAVLVGIALVCVLMMVGFTVFRPKATSHGIQGTVQLRQTSEAPGQCAGSGALAAVRGGAPVVVTDNDGAVLARATLSQGSTGASFGDDTLLSCSFSFRVRDVPDANIVRIAVADRTAIPFTRWQLRRSQWHAILTIGG